METSVGVHVVQRIYVSELRFLSPQKEMMLLLLGKIVLFYKMLLSFGDSFYATLKELIL